MLDPTNQDNTGTDPAVAPITEFELLLTAAEAWPAFERLCLGAQRSIRACFRVFDLTTALRSHEAREIGETWFDLLLHVLNKGVDVEIVVTDFDPILATDDHRRSWSSARQLAAVNELADGGSLRFQIAMHPARVGLVPRSLFNPKIGNELQEKDPDPLTPHLARKAESGKLSLVPATHHQKLAVIDGEQLYIGGLDLNERRFDDTQHDRPSEDTWQDMQAIVRGPVVAAAEAHLRGFRAVTEGRADPPPPAPGFLRTLSAKRAVELVHIAPQTVLAEIEQAHLDAIGRAQSLIYLETQFFRHKPLAQALADAAREEPGLACVLVMPGAPEDVAFDGNRRADAALGAQKTCEALDLLTDAFGDRVAIASPAQPRPAKAADAPDAIAGAPIVYVHSKLSIFDTREAILSSANLNGRSLRWDTEAGLHLTLADRVVDTRHRALAHWLGAEAPTEPELSDGPAFVARLRRMLDRNAAQSPQDRRHFLVPYDRSRDRELARPIPGVPDEMV